MKHIPQRTCVGCREVQAKRDLLRLVRSSDGGIVVDESGKTAGRGAYLCAKRGCWLKALGNAKSSSRGSSLSAALKASISDSDRCALLEYAAQLPD
jgi:predicted RNA-binding protein YlxR (DUF448 family)